MHTPANAAPRGARVASLLQHLVTLPDICLVLGPSEAVCEAFVDPASMDFSVDGAFVTMENGPWHIHLDASRVHQMSFAVTPDTVHAHPDRLSYSIRLLDSQGGALLRAFFLGMYDADGAVRAERVQQYEALRSRAGGQDTILVE